MRSVFIIIPVHNRKQITLTCLEKLKENGDLEQYSVCVVDDGSTDGTADAIACLYPDVVVLSGDGNLWWTGAIKKGMEYAYSQGAESFIWLNDDTIPSPGSIPLMVKTCVQSQDTLVSAQCYATDYFDVPTYGGQEKQHFSVRLLYAPKGQTIECDCMSGNLVCLPRSVIEKIGYPPNKLMPHCLADIVYTWEAKKAGCHLKVLGDATAVCAFNPLEEGWASSPISMKSRWQLIKTPKSNLYPSAYWHYCSSFYGKLAFIPFIEVYLRLILFTILRCMLPLKFIKAMKELKDQFMSK